MPSLEEEKQEECSLPARPPLDDQEVDDDVESAPIAIATAAAATNHRNGNGHFKQQQQQQQPTEKKRPSMLPEVTPELIREHEQAQMRKSMSRPGSSFSPSSDSKDDKHGVIQCLLYLFCPCHHDEEEEDAHGGESPTICGIPYYLFMILTALVAAVSTATILAVIYYDPSQGVQPPDHPSPAPTSLFTTMPNNSSSLSPTAT